MKVLLIPLIMTLTACSAAGDHRSSSAETSPECSRETMLALRDDVRRARAAFKPLNAAADRNPTEQNTAAASAAVADIVAAQATFEIRRDECGK